MKLYNDFVDVCDLAYAGAYMHPTSYKKIKDTLVLSTPNIDPINDTMEVLMQGIIKRINKWVEWTQVKKTRTGSTNSMSGV